MPQLIQAPTILEAAGTKPKRIEEFAGRVNTRHEAISVARMVMEKTPHVMLVGKGAELFAKSMGFKKQNLLTKDAMDWFMSHYYDEGTDVTQPLMSPLFSGVLRGISLPLTFAPTHLWPRSEWIA